MRKEGRKMIFFIKKGEWSEYDPEQDAKEVRKFLMYRVPVEGDILVVGSQSKHELLDQQTKDQAIVPAGLTPIAAGDTSEGLIVGWQSIGFDFKTAPELRPGIAENLKMENICKDIPA